jgi:hypothetical protein
MVVRTRGSSRGMRFTVLVKGDIQTVRNLLSHVEIKQGTNAKVTRREMMMETSRNLDQLPLSSLQLQHPVVVDGWEKLQI